jgi:hypothetical protein
MSESSHDRKSFENKKLNQRVYFHSHLRIRHLFLRPRATILVLTLGYDIFGVTVLVLFF